jgi:hypothetical protein
MKGLAELLNDLITLQNYVERDVLVPGKRPLVEFEALQTIARALRGERVRLKADTWSLTLAADKVSAFLKVHADRPGTGLFVTFEDATFDFDERTYSLGAIAYYGPNMVLKNEAELAEEHGRENRSPTMCRPTARAFTFSRSRSAHLRPVEQP